MSLNGNIDIESLIEEREKWKKKFEEIESENVLLRKKLEECTINYENKNVEIKNFTKIKTDILMKYEYMDNKCEYLKIKVNILTLEKEEEIKKKNELQKIINKQKKEIEGYKKILEKVKNLNITFRKRKNEAENQIYSMIDDDLLIKNDNILLKEIIKVNDKLNSVNNKVNEKMKGELEKTKKKLHIANNKIKKFHEAFINISNRYSKHKEEKEKKLSLALKNNQELIEELEKKKSIEKYNMECTTKLEEYNATNTLLNYYEIKYKVNDRNKSTILNYVNLLSNIFKTEEIDNSNEIEKDILLYELYNIQDQKSQNYDKEMNLLKSKILQEDNYSQINTKKKNPIILNTSLYQHEEIEESSLDTFILNNLNSSNIVEILYYNIKIVNDLLECFNITLLLILYLYNTYLKEIISNINNYSYLQILEKSHIRFAAYFFISLSNFLLSTLKYIHIIKNSDSNDYLKLLYNKRVFHIFCLGKYNLEQYIEKIKIKLFSSNIDYSILTSLSDQLNNLYDFIFSENTIPNENIKADERNDQFINEGNKKKTKDEMKTNKELLMMSKMDKKKKQDKENPKNKKILETEEEQYITAFELFCYLNVIIASSILLINDKDILFDSFNDINMHVQKEILIKCEYISQLIKIPKKISSFYFCVKKYKYSFEKFIKRIQNYKSIIIDNINYNENNKKAKNSTLFLNELSANILNDLSALSENVNNYVIDGQDEKEFFFFHVCNKYIERYKNIIKNKNKNVIEKKVIEEKENIIIELKKEVTDLENIICSLNKKMNLLTIKEEKCKKLQIDLDILKKEKNEYLNIINDLRKSKNESANEIAYITKQYNETKHKYSELLKCFEPKKKYLNNHKNNEQSNMDIYYMKKIINNLYYENFLNKINKNYHLYDEKMNYYNNIYNKYSNINFLYKDENGEDENLENKNINNKNGIKNEDETNIMLNQIFGEEIYFINRDHKVLFDDIYNCELIKNRLTKHKINYFKNNLYQTTLCNSFDKGKNKYMEIVDIIESYKKLKNEIINEILNMSISNNMEKQIKKNRQISEYLYRKLTELKSVIKKFYINNNLKNLNKNVPTLDNILNITIGNKSDKEQKQEQMGNNTNKNINKETYLHTNKVILSDQSLSYLIQNIFNL